MCLKSLISLVAGVALLTICSQQRTEAEVVKPAGNDTLLLRVQFAGTTALMANTNAAYLTNLAALPETAALGTQLVIRVASLSTRLLFGAEKHPTSKQSTSSKAGEQLRPVFTEMLRDGFTLELRGDCKGVTGMAMAAKASGQTAQRWNNALAGAAKHWFGTEPVKSATGEGWTAGDGAVNFRHSRDWILLAISKTGSSAPLTAIEKTISNPDLETGNVLEGELASSLTPDAIRQSAYGGFTRLKISVTPAEQNLKIRGTASYAQDLPALGRPPSIPTTLFADPLSSFTVVRTPNAWLAPDSAWRRFVPNPIPEGLFFWGTFEAPFAFYAAMPSPEGKKTDLYMTSLTRIINEATTSANSGTVTLDAIHRTLQWNGVPFASPSMTESTNGSLRYLVAGLLARTASTNHLPSELIARVSNRTNLVVYDWELTGPRLAGWLYISQLALMLSHHQQLGETTPSSRWILESQKTLPNGGNTVTEITQTGPRELALARRAPVAFTSTEILWLANWLESTNFPAANFLVPVAQ